MSISQSDIDALIGAATELEESVNSEAVEESAPSRAVVASGPVTPPTSDELQRILDIQVRVSVTLAEKHMTIEEILRVAVGTIVEFDRAFDSELIISVGDKPVGTGQAVKIGENFGLRIAQVGDAHQRVDAMLGHQ